jgi:hypothetical protein
MTDMSPTGAPFAISERVSSSAQLEHAYRRLVQLYPRSFRRESTEEIIAVLLATARADQRYPSVLEAADLLRGAARMWLGLSNCPRTVLYAVRLMYLGALAEIAVLVTLLVTSGSISAAVRANAIRSLGPHPDHAAAAQATANAATVISNHLDGDILVLLLAVAGWLVLAWSSGKGWGPARGYAIILCAVYTSLTALDVSQGTWAVAPAAVIASAVTLTIGVTAVGLLLAKPSWRFYGARTAAATATR